MFKNPLPILLTFVLGCTATLEDFYGMSRYKRADIVCSESEIARERKSKISQLGNEFRKIQLNVDQKKELLERGYRIHRYCRQIPIQIEPNCEDNDDCAVQGYTQSCEETPVAINYDYEEKKLQQLEDSLDLTKYSLNAAEVVWELAYAECHKKVQALSVQESFRYYESGREP